VENNLTKEDWEEWLRMPQTMIFREAIREEQLDLLQFVIKREDIDALKQARIIGIMSGLQKVLDIDYND
jgi:hypothetical protein